MYMSPNFLSLMLIVFIFLIYNFYIKIKIMIKKAVSCVEIGGENYIQADLTK